MCPGTDTSYTFSIAEFKVQGEHTVKEGGAYTQPSRCTLPMFHPDMDPEKASAGPRYVSNDGHHFQCKKP